MEFLSEQCNTILERVVGAADSDKYANCIQAYVLSKCHDLLVEQCKADRFERVALILSVPVIRLSYIIIMFEGLNLPQVTTQNIKARWLLTRDGPYSGNHFNLLSKYSKL